MDNTDSQPTVDALPTTRPGDGRTRAPPARQDPDSRILLVDPDEHRRERLRDRVVADLGGVVLAAADQTTALQWLQRLDVDCLVTADRLEGTSGRELLRWVQTGPSDATGVLIVGDDDGERARASRRAGASGGEPAFEPSDLTLDVGAVVPDAEATVPGRLAAAVRRAVGADPHETIAEDVANLFEDADVGTVLYGRDGRIEYANERASLLVANSADLVGRPAWEALPTIAREGFDGRWEAVEPGDVRIESTNCVVGGTALRHFDLATVRVGRGGRPYHLVFAIERPGLTGRDAEFAALVGHELRTWLEECLRALSAARESGERYHLERLDRSLVRITDLLETELDAARGGLRVEDAEAHDVNAVARTAWQHVDTADATLVVRDSSAIVADRELLLRAFEHLFRNSVAHCGDDVTVTVDVEADALVVEDDGPGIPAEHRDRVFQRGFTTTGDDGLGLTIVERIADAHGWSVEMTEGRTRGARVEIENVAVAPAGET